MKSLKIQHRLLLGFGSIIVLLALSISLTMMHVRTAKENTDRIVSLRVPTVLASSSMAKDIHASLASLRGWMLTGDPGFKSERANIWAAIAKTKTVMDTLSRDWTHSGNIDKWQHLTVILDEFSAAQNQVEAIAHTANERPATKILVTEAAPRAAKMLQLITMMIDLEVFGNGSKNIDLNNNTVISAMADVRGTLGASLASIKAYLLTGDKQFRDEFTEQWAENEARFSDLSRLTSLLSPEQNAVFDRFKALRAEYVPLPAKMFEIRASRQWNMSTYLLVTEAIPRADRLLALLSGGVREDGSHTQGIVENQRMLLEKDNNIQIDTINKLITMQEGVLFIGVITGLFISFYIARSISTPIMSITTAMRRLAAGELDINIPALGLDNEIGSMAKAVQVFRQNAIDRNRIEKQKIATMRELDFLKLALDEHAIVSVTDVRGIITYANDKFCEISNYSRDELLGQSHRIIKSGEHSAEFYADLWKTISSGKSWHGEIKNLKKGGGYYWMKATIVPFFNEKGKPFQYVGIRTDITDRKKIEEELRKSHNDLELRVVERTRELTREVYERRMIEAELREKKDLQQLLYTITAIANEAEDIDGAMVSSLKEVCDYMGWPVGHIYVVSRSNPDILLPTDIWHLENPKRYATFYEITMKTRFRKGEGMPGRVLASGEPEWIEDVNKTPVFLRAHTGHDIAIKGGFAFPVKVKGKVGGVMEFFSPKAHKVDQVILETMQYAGDQIGRLIERDEAKGDLRQAMNDANTANKAKSTFLASMSHELRTPLNAILGFGQFLQHNPKEKLSKTQNDSVDHILEGGRHLLQLINEVLDLARIEAGKTNMSIVDVEITEMCCECLKMVEAMANERNINVSCSDFNNETRIVRADELQLRQVLLNLLSNAIKYNRQGGDVDVVFSDVANAMLRVSIIDTGSGIPEHQREEMFKPFSRLGPEANQIEGTGIGLTVTRKLVQLMGGQIGYDSHVGVGSTFWIELPLA